MSNISECKSCGAEVVWMKTYKGKNMPVDLPSETDEDVTKASREEVIDAEVYIKERMTSHFATCPQADEHRAKATAPAGSTPTATPSDAGINTKRLNTAIAALEDIATKDADGMRSITLARTALSQIRQMR